MHILPISAVTGALSRKSNASLNKICLASVIWGAVQNAMQVSFINIQYQALIQIHANQIVALSKAQIPLWLAYILIYSLVPLLILLPVDLFPPPVTGLISTYQPHLGRGYATHSRPSPEVFASQVSSGPVDSGMDSAKR
jgi:hypothetical protein